MKINAKAFSEIARTVFAPIYPVIAEQIVAATGITRGTCLDVGCGVGSLGAALARRTELFVYFLDQSEEMLDLTEHTIDENDLRGRTGTLAGEVGSIALPDGQDALIEAVSAANPKTVVVLESGGPVLMPWLDKVKAVLAAWYPGQRGGEAIARILFGEVNPSGRLPMTFPAAESQAPRPSAPGFAEQAAIDEAGRNGQKVGKIKPFAVDYVEGAAVGYRWYAEMGLKPLFPFGYGLSYTSFQYTNLTVEGGVRLTVSFDVTNKGQVAGADTSQLYVQAGERKPMLRLAGFKKLDLAPGETSRVSLTVDPRVLADYDVKAGGWRLPQGSYGLYVGTHAGDKALTGEARLDAWKGKP